MNFARYTILLFCVFILNNLMSQKPIEFTAFADTNQVVEGGFFEVTFTLTNSMGADFRPPKFKNLNILLGPMSSISSFSVNGEWFYNYNRSYTLQPKRNGKNVIKSASIKVDGKKYRTKRVIVKVISAKEYQELYMSDQ